MQTHVGIHVEACDLFACLLTNANVGFSDFQNNSFKGVSTTLMDVSFKANKSAW